MLVLSRKAGESVKIGDQITLEVRRIAGNRVTIAFKAPKDVRILRGELQQAVEAFESEPEGATAPALEAEEEQAAGAPTGDGAEVIPPTIQLSTSTLTATA